MAARRAKVPPRTRVSKNSALTQGYKAGQKKTKTRLGGWHGDQKGEYGLEGPGSRMYQVGYGAGRKKVAAKGQSVSDRSKAQAKRAATKKAASRSAAVKRGSEGPKRRGR